MLSYGDVIGIAVGGGVALLCVALGIALCAGRGAALIAGYNTATEEEKRNVNEKALCRAVGVYMFVIGAVIAGIVYGGLADMPRLAGALIVLAIVSVVPLAVYVNTSKRIKKR